MSKRSYGSAFNPIVIGGKRAMGVVRTKLRARRAFIRGRDRGPAGYWGRYSYGTGRGGGELKFHDIDVDDAVIAAGTNIANTGTVNIIPQGITEITRVGRKCVVKSINWKYSISMPVVTDTAGAPTADTVRVVLYLDKQCNGATAASSGITGILRADDFQSFRELSNVSRFVILMDRTVSLNYLAAGGNGTINDFAEVKRHGTFNKKCNIPLEFNAAAGALTEIRSNNLGVMLCSEQGVAGFESKLRLRFSDA